ncbi:MAG: Gfo/Idh/MocA family protein [Planctomycetaceae bacterium]
MRKLRLALIGCGDVAHRDYLPEFHRLADRAELVAVCGRSDNRARATAAQYGIPAWYTDYALLLAEVEADAVINLSPIQHHAEIDLAVLESGRHVYSEKPVAGSVRDVARLRDVARRRGLTMVCAPSVMLFPQVRSAQRLLDEIGEVHLARGCGHGGVPPWPGYTSDPSPFFARGAGPAIDMGVYPLHALTGLLGAVQRVTAMSARAQRRFVVTDGPATGQEVITEVDDNWQMILDFGGGRLATVDANNCVQGSRAPQLELYGLSGTIAVDLLDVSAPLAILRAGKDWETLPASRSGRASGPDHLLGVEHLVDCLERRQAPILSVEHALHVVEVVEKAARAAAEGRTLDIESTLGHTEG